MKKCMRKETSGIFYTLIKDLMPIIILKFKIFSKFHHLHRSLTAKFKIRLTQKTRSKNFSPFAAAYTIGAYFCVAEYSIRYCRSPRAVFGNSDRLTHFSHHARELYMILTYRFLVHRTHARTHICEWNRKFRGSPLSFFSPRAAKNM